MPIISIFLGIVVRMYYNDHEPPHFHATYAEYRAIISIETGKILKGKLPPRAYRITLEWLELNRGALNKNWELARSNAVLNSIPPLE